MELTSQNKSVVKYVHAAPRISFSNFAKTNYILENFANLHFGK